MDLYFQISFGVKKVAVEIWRLLGANLALTSPDVSPKRKIVETWDQVHLVRLEIL